MPPTWFAARYAAARALEWVPYLMDIDAAAVHLNALYDLLAEPRLPLIVHAGWQHPLLAQGNQNLGNALLFDLVLERCMSYPGFGIANKVLESAAFLRGAAFSASTRS